jgi:hypothetical protein
VPGFTMAKTRDFLHSYAKHDVYPENLIHDRDERRSQQYKALLDGHALGMFRESTASTYVLVPFRDYGNGSKGGLQDSICMPCAYT